MKPYPLLLIFCCLCFFSCSINSDKENEIISPFLGFEPVQNAALVELQSDALVLWARQGIHRKQIAVHCSSHDGLAPVSLEKIRQIRSLIKQKQWEELGQSGRRGQPSLFTSRNYISAAALLGIVDKIYWVIPEPWLLYSDAEARVRRFLENHPTQFRREDIDSMIFDRGCVSGKLYGVPTSICSLETLPVINDRVVFDVDVDFLLQFASTRRFPRLRGLKDFFDIITTKRLKTTSAAVGVTDLPAQSVRRYVGTQTVEALRKPQLMKVPSPPELWLMRDATDNSFFAGDDVTPAVRVALKKYPADKPLVLFGAVSKALRGSEEPALESLGRLCKEDRDNCFGLLYAGSEMLKQQHHDAAERFFKKAVAVRPNWPEALLAYGDLLYARQDYRSALKIYTELERLENDVSIQLALSDCLQLLDQKNEAMKHLDQGLVLYGESIGYRFSEREKNSLARFIKLYDDQGDAQRVKIIRQILGMQ